MTGDLTIGQLLFPGNREEASGRDGSGCTGMGDPAMFVRWVLHWAADSLAKDAALSVAIQLTLHGSAPATMPRSTTAWLSTRETPIPVHIGHRLGLALSASNSAVRKIELQRMQCTHTGDRRARASFAHARPGRCGTLLSMTPRW